MKPELGGVVPWPANSALVFAAALGLAEHESCDHTPQGGYT